MPHRLLGGGTVAEGVVYGSYPEQVSIELAGSRAQLCQRFGLRSSEALVEGPGMPAR